MPSALTLPPSSHPPSTLHPQPSPIPPSFQLCFRSPCGVLAPRCPWPLHASTAGFCQSVVSSMTSSQFSVIPPASPPATTSLVLRLPQTTFLLGCHSTMLPILPHPACLHRWRLCPASSGPTWAIGVARWDQKEYSVPVLSTESLRSLYS